MKAVIDCFPRWVSCLSPERLDVIAREYAGLYRLKQVIELTGLSKTTIYAKVAEGEFPRFVKIGNITAWKAADVHAWLDELEYAV